MASPPIGTAAGLPKVVIELDDGTGAWPYDISAWVDLTASVTVKRGRNDQASQIDPSELQVMLDNSDGRFTVDSAQYGCYLDQPIRCSWVIDGTTYRRFTGFVQKWPIAWRGGPGRFARTAVTAVDPMPRWSRRSMQNAAQAYAISTLKPAFDAYWSMADALGSLVALPYVGTEKMQGPAGQTPPTFGIDMQLDGVSTPGMYLNAGYLNAPLPPRNTAPTFAGYQGITLQFALRTSVKSQTIMIESGARTGANLTVSIDAAGGLVVVCRSVSGAQATVTTNLTVADGVTHIIEIETIPNQVSARVDAAGTSVNTSTTVDATDQRFLALTGSAAYAQIVYSGQGRAYSFSTLTMRDLLRTSLTTFYAISTRLKAVLTQAGTTVSPTSDSGTLTQKAALNNEGSIQDQVDVLALAEGGLVFVGADGLARLQNRSYRPRRTVALTVPTDAADPDEDFGIEFDLEGLVNYWSGQRTTNGDVEATTIAVRNDPSIAVHDRRESTGNAMAVETDQQVEDRGRWVVGSFAEPRPRFPNVTLDLLTCSRAFQKAAAALEISDRIALGAMPSQAPDLDDQVVEGWTETVQSGGKSGESIFSMAFNLTSFAYFRTWILEDAESGSLDGPGRLYF